MLLSCDPTWRYGNASPSIGNGRAMSREGDMCWLTGIVGMAFVAAPFVLGYSGTDPVGSWCSILVGTAVVLISVKWGVSSDKVASGCEALAVSWFSLISPLELGFRDGDDAKLIGLVLGGMLVLLVSLRMLLGYGAPEPKRPDAGSRKLGEPCPVKVVETGRATRGDSHHRV
jgi:hypothetical protein